MRRAISRPKAASGANSFTLKTAPWPCRVVKTGRTVTVSNIVCDLPTAVITEKFDLEYCVVWPDNSIHWVHSVAGLINDADGDPLRMVGVLYEISDQKHLRLAPELTQQEMA